MAVDPVRALLIAHFQSNLNRSFRQLSRRGLGMMVVGVLVLVLLIFLPLVLGVFFVGYIWGSDLGGPDGESVILGMGAVLSGIVFTGGVLAGILGDTKKLGWEQLRGYPVPISRLMMAEVAAGVGELSILGMAAMLATYLLGIAVTNLTLLPMLLLVFLEHMLLILVLQLLFGSLAQRLIKRFKLVTRVFFLVVWLGGIWIGQNASNLGDGDDAEMVRLVREKLEILVEFTRFFPTTIAVRGLHAAAQGDWLLALADQLFLLSVCAGVAVAAAYLLAREKEDLEEVIENPDVKEKLWSFRTAMNGLARLQFQTLFGSHHGRFGFLMPVMVMILVRGPLMMVQGRSNWTVPGGFAYLSIFLSRFHFNQFGMDGHGVKTLFLLPVPARDLLEGKWRGLLAYQLLQALFLVALMVPLVRPDITELLASVALLLCFFFSQSAAGAFVSCWMPQRIDRSSLRNNQLSMTLVLLSTGFFFAALLVFGAIFGLLRFFVPQGLLPGMIVLAALCRLAHHCILGRAATFLDRRKETIVNAVG